MKIINGEFEVLDSGRVYSPDLSDTKFVISESPEMNIVFRIILDDKKENVSLEVLDDNTLAVIYSNPEGLGFGTEQPIKVGLYEGKELFVSFFVTAKGNNVSYSLDYSFFKKGVDIHG